MKIIKINLHSIIDLITNSSTVIFTYSRGSLPAVKELIAEICKTFGINESFDDMFYAKVLPEEVCEHDTAPDDCDELLIKYIKDEIEFQPWMEAEERYDYYSESTKLYLIPKDKKYEMLASQLLNYLYSTNHDATRDG